MGLLRDTHWKIHYFENKRMKSIVLAFSLMFIDINLGSEPSLGNCPDLRGIRNFTIENYTGRWYEYSRLFLIGEVFGECVRATYTDNGDGSVGVFNEQISSLTGQYVFINGSATPVDPEYAEFVVNFYDVPVENSRPNYRVLATDYLNYAIVYDCLDILNIFKAESLWLLTRSQFPDQDTVDQGYEMMREWNLPVSSLKVTNQTGCQNLPTFL